MNTKYTYQIKRYTGGHISWCSKFSGKHFCYFDHLPNRIQKQMIPHLKTPNTEPLELGKKFGVASS